MGALPCIVVTTNTGQHQLGEGGWMPAELEIRHIRNANPTSVRSDLGPLEELIASIKKNGIQVPILLKEDFLVIDGARRLASAEALKHKTVPIIICHTWEDVAKHLRPSEPDCLPMDWPDLVAFWYDVLAPIHQQAARAAAVVTRRSGATPAQQDRPIYSGYILELAQIYGTQPTFIKTMRDYIHRLEIRKAEFPLFYEGVYKALPHGEAARDLTQIRILKSCIENLVNGFTDEEYALDVFRRRMAGEHVSRRESGARTKPTVNMTPRTIESLMVFVDMIESLSHEASLFNNFKVTQQEADQVIARIRRAVTPISRMRKRLYQATRGEGKA